MLFGTPEYLIFFIVVFFTFWSLARFKTLRLLFLLLASWFFYMSWNPAFLFLILVSTAIDYICGWKIYSTKEKRNEKAYLVASLAANLSLLFFFKYSNFALHTVQGLSGIFGSGLKLPHLDIVLPVGISFYTFQTLSYTIDVYRGKIKPETSLIRYALYVAFFPQLVAGPIVRASQFIPQFYKPRIVTYENAVRAFYLIFIGLAKKLVISDYLAKNLIDRVFEEPLKYSATETLASVYGFAVQVYCDFSGYSDIAIGSALLLGFSIPINFQNPYRAENIQDFWRRWHISLSTWLRDYLYVPLGGSRKGSFNTYRNLIITMFLGGLWHGAAWTIVTWGLLHGILLAFTRMWQRAQERKGRLPSKNLLVRAIKIFLTFHFHCFSLMIFRSDSFGKVGMLVENLASFTLPMPNLPATLLTILAVGYLSHWVPERIYLWGQKGLAMLPSPLLALVLAAATLGIAMAAQKEVIPFIYFQF